MPSDNSPDSRSDIILIVANAYDIRLDFLEISEEVNFLLAQNRAVNHS